MIIPMPIIMHSGSGGVKFSELSIFGKVGIITLLVILLVIFITLTICLIREFWELWGPEIKKWFKKRKKDDESGNGR